ncbi:protein-L-isoaspartate(D-aspartate) O-methyltransferase, partial [Streptomyces daliensis]|nr:protein-L-isoaspartate(D-aspartate) O-methyltransferase [Streptomyces daliensis]
GVVAGTGYNTALLCERVGQRNVFSKEVDASVADLAQTNLEAAGYAPAVHCGDGEEGFPHEAPYDRLISTASVHRVPQAWLTQVKKGGEIVTPWLPNGRALGLIWLRVREPGEVARGWFHGGETFMAVRGQRPTRPDISSIWNETRDAAEQVPGPLDIDLDVHGEFALAVTLPGVTPYKQDDGWFFLTDDEESWLRITGEKTTQYGTRDLIRSLRDALGWWERSGRPRLFDFGVTVTPESHTVWLGKDRAPVPHYV